MGRKGRGQSASEKKKADAQFFRDPDRIAAGLLGSKFLHDPKGSDKDSITKEERDAAAFTLAYWQDDFYCWRDGCYYKIPDSDTKAIVTQHMQRLKIMAQDEEQDVRITTANVNNVILCLKGLVHIPSERCLNSWPDQRDRQGIHSVAFANGILMYYPSKSDPSPVLAKSTPHFFNVVKLPYDYDPAATCKPWVAFLDGIMLGDQAYITLLQRWLAYLLRPDLWEHKFLLTVGEGANGKGVFAEVVEAFIGRENCSHVALNRFSSAFAPYRTYGKLANITNESSSMIDDEAESVLKAFVAGDRFTFERKHKDSIEAVPTAKIMISTNALPRFKDKTQGIWRRILLVPFKKVVPPEEQIKGLASEIIKTDLPGIFNWALEGLPTLNRDGFLVPQANAELMEEYRKDSDPARAFLTDHFTSSPNGQSMPCSEAYQSYRQWCEDSGYRRMGDRAFGHEVRRVFPDVERVRVGSRANRQYEYRGTLGLGTWGTRRCFRSRPRKARQTAAAMRWRIGARKAGTESGC